MATIKDIASKTGYSIGTVSRVINNKSDVSEEARTRIEEAIKELDFHPNRNAKMLKQVAPSGIAVIVRGIGNRFLNSIFEKIRQIFSRTEKTSASGSSQRRTTKLRPR